MKAAVLGKYGEINWREVPDPVMKEKELLIKVHYASICGSDQHIFKGEFHPRTKLPLIPGHEFSGVIKNTGKDVVGFLPGDKVVVDPIIWCGKCEACKRKHYPACINLKLIGIDLDGGFGEYVSVPFSMAYKLHPNTNLESAALIELASIGFHACNRAGIKKEDTVLIWGAGKVGQSILQAVKCFTDNKIFLVDMLENRLKVAKSIYSDIVTINATEQDPLAVVKNFTDGKGVDIAFEAVGHAQDIPGVPHPVRGCVKAIRGAGVVCVLGLAEDPAPLVMKELIWKEASIVASRVSHGEFKQAISQLESGNIKPNLLITSRLHAKDTFHAFELLEKEPGKHIKIVLEFE